MSLEPAIPDQTLCVLAWGARQPDWVVLDQQLSRTARQLRQIGLVQTPQAMLRSLRCEAWDLLLISACEWDTSLSVPELSAVLQAIRDMGVSSALLLVTDRLSLELAELCALQACPCRELAAGWFNPAIGAVIESVLLHHRTERELRVLQQQECLRQAREREEAERILTRQRTLLTGIVAQDRSWRDGHFIESGIPEGTSRFPTRERMQVVPEAEYLRQLQAYVMADVNRLEGASGQATRFLEQGWTPREVMACHLRAVERLVSGQGIRSSQHLLQRADLFLLEILVEMAEVYRLGANASFPAEEKLERPVD
ncbi:MAG: hypothetical protein KDA76_11930 [Planctomycetaceae bacterium]|nr:hypothetical protein [Planctomycetaceae bacterium]